MAIDGSKLISTINLEMQQLPDLIKVKAAIFELEPLLVAAVILQESGAKPWRRRYEPGFYRRRIANLKREDFNGFVPDLIPTLETEKIDRSTSWGLMQVMGDTARGQGFREEDMAMLLTPELNLQFGCKYLRHVYEIDLKLSPAQHSQETDFFVKKGFLTPVILQLPEPMIRVMMQLLRYNGGANLAYPGEVLNRKKNGTAQMLLNKA